MSWASGQVTIQSTWKTHCNLQLSKGSTSDRCLAWQWPANLYVCHVHGFLVFECVWHFDQIVMLSHRSSAVGRRTLDTNVATCRTWLQKMFPNNLQRRGSKKDWLKWESPKMSEIQKLTNNFDLADLQLTLLCPTQELSSNSLLSKLTADSWQRSLLPVLVISKIHLFHVHAMVFPCACFACLRSLHSVSETSKSPGSRIWHILALSLFLNASSFGHQGRAWESQKRTIPTFGQSSPDDLPDLAQWYWYQQILLTLAGLGSSFLTGPQILQQMVASEERHQLTFQWEGSGTSHCFTMIHYPEEHLSWR